MTRPALRDERTGADRADPAAEASRDLLAVIVPASNEEGYLGPCLDALLASDAAAAPAPQPETRRPPNRTPAAR